MIPQRAGIYHCRDCQWIFIKAGHRWHGPLWKKGLQYEGSLTPIMHIREEYGDCADKLVPDYASP